MKVGENGGADTLTKERTTTGLEVDGGSAVEFFVSELADVIAYSHPCSRSFPLRMAYC